METSGVVRLLSYLAVAVVVYGAAVQLLFWRIPRRRHWVPGIVVALAGALTATALVLRLWPTTPLFGELVAAALGSLGFVFAAVKVGTPASVVLTIDTAIDSGHLEEFAREGFEAPFVWPYFLAVEKYGSVIWELQGVAGTEVVVEFPKDETPFGTDRNGEPRFRFEGTVPGRIVASPTLRAGTGSYTIKKTTPEGAEVLGDPGWGIPRRKD